MLGGGVYRHGSGVCYGSFAQNANFPLLSELRHTMLPSNACFHPENTVLLQVHLARFQVSREAVITFVGPATFDLERFLVSRT